MKNVLYFDQNVYAFLEAVCVCTSICCGARNHIAFILIISPHSALHGVFLSFYLFVENAVWSQIDSFPPTFLFGNVFLFLSLHYLMSIFRTEQLSWSSLDNFHIDMEQIKERQWCKLWKILLGTWILWKCSAEIISHILKSENNDFFLLS